MRGLPDQRWRQLVATAARLYASRGTLTAIRTVIQMSTGQIPEIRESGGTAWSPEPIDTLPGWAEAELVIFLRDADLTVSESHLTELIAGFIPAHVRWRLELRAGDRG